MTVPSYEDLTPGIPDVVDAESVGALTSLFREDVRLQLPAFGSRLLASSSQLPSSGLFACLRLEQGRGKLAVDSRQREAVLGIARDFSPRVRWASEHEVLLDVAGLGRLIGPPDEIARQLAHALAGAGAAARVALGPTQTIARVLAHAGTAGHGSWRQLPVEWLQELETLPPAIADRDRARIYDTLERWGIATLGELAALPAADLASRLGRRGLALQRLAKGFDPSPFVPDGDTPRYIGRLELEWPIDTLEPLSFVLARLLEPLSAALERADRGAVAVRLDLQLTDRSTHTRLLQLPAAMRDARVLRTLLLLDLESSPLFAANEVAAASEVMASERRREPPPSGGASEVMIDIITIELDPAPARITQFSLLQRALPSAETLATLTARLTALVGESRVGSPALVDSHRSGACVMTRYAPEGANGAKDADGANGANGADGASSAPAVLRRERRSVILSVSVDHGRPVHIAASRRAIPSGAIVDAAGPWRTSGEWWIPDQQWSRNEWDVALKSGAVCRIYQDRTTQRWFFEGFYD
jgi:protein ImuB